MAITRRFQLGAESNGSSSHLTEPDAYGDAGCDATYKKSGSYSFKLFDAAGNTYIYKDVVATAQGRLSAHTMRAQSNYSAGVQSWLTFLDSGTNEVITIKWDNATGLYTLYLEGVLQDTGTFIDQVRKNNDNWIQIGVDFKIANSGGWINVYIDGVLDLQLTGDTLATLTTIDRVRMGATAGTAIESYWDDIYFDDTTGEAAALPVPDKRFEYIKPNGNGTTSDMDGSDGNKVDNYLLVDDQPYDSDTTYVYAIAAAVKDTYAMETVTVPSGWGISAVIPCLITRKTNAGDANQVKTVVRSNVSEAAGAAQDLGASYGLLWERQTTDPNGSGAWTQAALDAVEIGQESAGTF